MINMDAYSQLLLSFGLERKLTIRIRLEIFSGLLFIFSFPAFFLFLTLDSFILDINDFYFLLSAAFVVFSIFFSMYLESRDILSSYSLNDKITIYLLFLLKEILQSKKQSYLLRNRYFIIKLNTLILKALEQLLKVREALNNVFIFELRKEDITLIENIIKVFNKKVIWALLHDGKEDILIELLDLLLSLYSCTLSDYMISDSKFKSAYITFSERERDLKLKKLERLIANLNNVEINSRVAYIEKVRIFLISNKYFHTILISVVVVMILYFRDKLGIVADIATIGLPIGSGLISIWRKDK